MKEVILFSEWMKGKSEKSFTALIYAFWTISISSFASTESLKVVKRGNVTALHSPEILDFFPLMGCWEHFRNNIQYINFCIYFRIL